MEEFANNLEEDWGLQAIVRGCSHDHQAAPSFDPVTIHIPDIDDHIFAFPDLFGANSSDNDTVHANELDELYKPFYPMFNSFSRQTPITTSTNSFPEEEVKLNSVEIQIDLQKEKIPTQSTIVASRKIAARAATYKRRKNQHKRVVVQVTAEDISSDLWAWRKYGQKPIKGSPYPRSYYRCSSLKGCLARKQVEQSCSDPGMFIITYSAEHSHSQPTRRSSLAGTNRHKSTTAKSPSPVFSCLAKFKEPSSSPTSDITVISPTISNLMQSNTDEELIIPQKPITSEKIDILNDEQMVEDISNGDFDISSEILNADFFVGLEDLDRLISDSAFYNCSTK